MATISAPDFHRRHGARVARAVREAVLRSLAEGRSRSAHAASAHVCDRRQQVEELAALADGRRDAYLSGGRTAQRRFERPTAAGRDEYVSDPANPVPFIPRPIDMDDADAVEAVAGARSAFRVGSARRRHLEDRAARQAGAHHGRAARWICLPRPPAPTATGS